MIVARQEVPGKASIEKNRPVGCGMIRGPLIPKVFLVEMCDPSAASGSSPRRGFRPQPGVSTPGTRQKAAHPEGVQDRLGHLLNNYITKFKAY
jgi:hypothetical protein